MSAFEFFSAVESESYYTTTTTTTTTGSDAAAFFGALMFVAILLLPLIILLIAAQWKMFIKAGKPGWAAIVPFYNSWVLAEVGGKPGWWGLAAIFAYLIPIAGPVISLVIGILIALGVGKNFGRSTAFSIVGLWLFNIVGYVILGFGSSRYQPNNTINPAATTEKVPEIFTQNTQQAPSMQPQQPYSTPTPPHEESPVPPRNNTPPSPFA